MKRKLYLLRHSYAGSAGGIRDKDRALTMEGITATRILGDKLSEQNFNPQKILCSTAERASSTAINLMEELGLSEKMITYEEKLYEASVREALEIVNDCDPNVRSLLIIGHNPTITFFGEYLTATGIGNMDPCGMVTIEFNDIKWKEVSQGSGNFVSYLHPNN